MIIIREPIDIEIIKKKHNTFFDNIIKVVVDTEKKILALDAELHADLEELLLDNDSKQEHLWGANIFPHTPHIIEFVSFINIRPAQNNRSMEIQDPELKENIQNIIRSLIIH